MRLRLPLALLLIGAAALAKTDWDAAGKAWWAHVQFLADDKLEGRDVGSKGYEAAADYVAKRFERAGLAPGAGSTYSQPVAFIKATLDEPASKIELVRDGTAIPVTLGDDALLRWGSAPIPDVEAPLVFAGYGLNIPEAAYSDLKDPSLKGAVAVYLSGGPAGIDGNLRSHYSSAEERGKAFRAAGVVGSINIPNPRGMEVPWARLSANRLQERMSLADLFFAASTGSFSATWNPAKADQLLEGSGHTFAEILDAADHNRPLPHFALAANVRAHTATDIGKVQSRNVVGLKAGSDPKLKNEFVIVSAHLDHLGVGQPVNGDAIFNGAMDDASGIASLIEIARSLKTENAKPRRSIVFLAVTGEEKGELGSRYFAERPTVHGRMVADINMDMFLPLFSLHYLEVQGLNESTLGDDIRAVAAAAGVEVQADKEPEANRFIRSDQYSFIKKGVPALAFKFGWIPGSPEEKIFKTWYSTRYHGVADDASQPVDLAGAAQFNSILAALIEKVADAPQAPQWKPDSFFRRFSDPRSSAFVGGH
jgi:Zn-dependent M28 family amino/carboxypeptidase